LLAGVVADALVAVEVVLAAIELQQGYLFQQQHILLQSVEEVLGALQVLEQTVQTLYLILLLLLAAAGVLVANLLVKQIRVVLAAEDQMVLGAPWTLHIKSVLRGLRGKALLAETLLVKATAQVVVVPLLLVSNRALRKMVVLVRLLLLLGHQYIVVVGVEVLLTAMAKVLLVVLVAAAAEVVTTALMVIPAKQGLLTQVVVGVGAATFIPPLIVALVVVLALLSFAMSFNNRRATSWHTTH
jgi:hypothetical protein